MRLLIRVISGLIILIISGCSLKRDLIYLGVHEVKVFESMSCLLNGLSEDSRSLEFIPGSGKPYRVIFRIDPKTGKCESGYPSIRVQWIDLEVDEIPDLGKSSLRLTGRAKVFFDNQLVCQKKDLIVAYSDWYRVDSLSLSEFRPPENTRDPVISSKLAFRRFLNKFESFLVQDCVYSESL